MNSPIAMSVPTPREFYARLEPLTPEGTGTGQLECLSGYICRVAHHHWLTPYGLCDYVVNQYINAQSDRSSITQCVNYTLNGQNLTAVKISTALSRATGRTDLLSLSFHGWAPALDRARKGLLHKSLYWCPDCWKGDLKLRRDPHIRLAWMSSIYACCPTHGRMLSHECPRCFSEQRAIPQLPVPWLCQHCGYDLYARRLSSTERKRRTPTNRQLWYARSVEKLIERSCANGERIQEGCVSAAIDRLVNQHALSSVSILGEKLNINTRYLKSWHSGISRPTLQSLADLCYRIDVPIDKFLLDSDVLTSPDMWRHLSKPHFIESTRLGDRMRKEIKATLRRFISNPPKVPPSVTDIAAQFDLSHTTLRSHFPEEYEILKKRASLWRQKCSDENQRVRLRNLCIAVKALADAGVYPGERQLRKSELLIASDFRRPDFLLKLRELQHRYRHLYDKDICR